MGSYLHLRRISSVKMFRTGIFWVMNPHVEWFDNDIFGWLHGYIPSESKFLSNVVGDFASS